MNIIYRLVNRQKEKLGEFPCYYIGSKLNYSPGKYWGSSHHPTLLKELATRITDFEMEILAVVNEHELTAIEHKYQLQFDAVNDHKYYNLHLANEKFSSSGKKWFHDPITLARGYFPPNKIPTGWAPGYKALSEKTDASIKAQHYKNNPTGLHKDSPILHQQISNTVAKFEWIVQDPTGTQYKVTKLHKFCQEHNLTPQLRYASNLNVPMKKGKSKGWVVISKKEIGA